MSTRIEELEKELKRALNLVERKVHLLEEIRARPDQKATHEEIVFLNARPPKRAVNQEDYPDVQT